MPPVLMAAIPAVIGAGTAIYAGSQQNKAAKVGLAAQTDANDKSLQLQRETRDSNVALNQPFIAGGQGAYAQLLKQFNVNQPAPAQPTVAPSGGYPTADQRRAAGGVDGGGGGAGATNPAPGPGSTPAAGNPGGGFDAQAYLAQNPDVASSQWLASQNVGDLNGDGKSDQTDQAQWHFQNYGQAEGRQAPQLAPQPAQAPAAQPAQPGQDLMTAARPTAPQAPTFTTPNTGQAPNMGPAPTFGPAPDQAQFFGNFQESPGFKFAVEQATRGVNAGYGARGLLKSGAAINAVQQRATDLANQDYGNWFNRQNALYGSALGQYNTTNARDLAQYNTANARDLAQWNANTDRTLNQANIDRNVGMAQYNTDVNRQDLNFNNDRQYQTSRADTNTGNLFSLTNIGLGAAGNVSGANSAYANNASNIFGSQANAASDAAAARAGANAGMVGAIGGAASSIAGNYLNPFAGSTAIGAPQVSGAGYQINPFNPASVSNLTNRVPNVVF
jgi:hypothetical protein